MTARSAAPEWVTHAIWWQVYPLGFTGAPIREADRSPRPRLRQLFDWLDYVVQLGASGLALGPVFASSTHGYDTIDYFRVDPRLGDEADLDELIAQCHRRGLKVLLDGVFNHVGSEHPLIRRALTEGRDSEAGELFTIDWRDADRPRPRVFEGHDGLVELNHRSPAVADLVSSVMRYWLARGVDGWRLDAAYAVNPRLWSTVLPQIRVEFPGAWFVGEMLHGDYADYVERSTLDSVTQYELWKAVWSGIADRNFFELDWSLRRHNEFLDTFIPATFIGNHDVTRIASRLGPDRAVLALVVLMTVGGIPTIYYGDEQGYTGRKSERIGGDDEVRPPFPAQPADLADWGAPVLRAHQDLIGIRRRHPWLACARTEAVALTNTRYVYRVTSPTGEGALEVELDVTDTPSAAIRRRDGEVLWHFSH